MYERYEQYRVTEDSSLIVGEIANENELKQLQDNKWIKSSPEEIEEKYYKLSKEDLKEIGIENEDDEYIVNYKTGECFNLTKKRSGENNYELYTK